MTDPLLADELRGVVHRLARRLEAATRGGDLPRTHRAILAVLDTTANLTSADIARREHVSPQAVNLAVGALVRDGLVDRCPDPDDGRRRVLSLTPAGRHAIRSVRAEKDAWLDEQLAGLTDAERAAVADALGVLCRIADTP